MRSFLNRSENFAARRVHVYSRPLLEEERRARHYQARARNPGREPRADHGALVDEAQKAGPLLREELRPQRADVGRRANEEENDDEEAVEVEERAHTEFACSHEAAASPAPPPDANARRAHARGACAARA